LTVGLAVGFSRSDISPAGTDVHAYVLLPVPPLTPAFSCTDAPAQTIPGVAVGVDAKAPPVIVMVTASVLEHVVAVDVATKVKVVVAVRFIVVGSSTEAFNSCADGVHEYVNGPVPVTDALIVVDVPYGIGATVPASTTGNEFTVTPVGNDNPLWQLFPSVTLTV